MSANESAKPMFTPVVMASMAICGTAALTFLILAIMFISIMNSEARLRILLAVMAGTQCIAYGLALCNETRKE